MRGTQGGNFKIFYALSIAWQLGFLIAVTVGGFLFLGVLADRFLGVPPAFLILGALIGIGASIYESYAMLLPLIEDEDAKHHA